MCQCSSDGNYLSATVAQQKISPCLLFSGSSVLKPTDSAHNTRRPTDKKNQYLHNYLNYAPSS